MLNTILNYLQNVQNCIGKEAYIEAEDLWTIGFFILYERKIQWLLYYWLKNFPGSLHPYHYVHCSILVFKTLPFPLQIQNINAHIPSWRHHFKWLQTALICTGGKDLSNESWMGLKIQRFPWKSISTTHLHSFSLSNPMILKALVVL